MVTSVASGMQTAVIDTEHLLTTQTTAGVYVLVLDTDNLVNGDIIEIRLKTKAKTGEASKLAYEKTYAHVQAEKIKYSIPTPIDTEIVATLKQVAGTGRDFVWNLLKM